MRRWSRPAGDASCSGEEAGMTDRFYAGLAWNPITGRTGDAVYFDLDKIPHMTLLGPTGGGKGQIEVFNLLSDGLKGVNVISVDPTGQNACVTQRYRSTFSDVVFLNPYGLHGLPDAGCNPLLSVETFEDAMAVGEAIEEVRPDAREPLWPEGTQRLLGGVVLGVVKVARARKETPTLERVINIVLTDIEGFASFMAQNGDHQLKGLLSRYQPQKGDQSNRTIESIKQIANNAVTWGLSDPLRKSLSVDKGIDWTRLKHGPRPLSVYLILAADRLGPSTGAPWLRLMVVSALNTLYRLGGGGRKTLFMLSEFAALGRLQPVIAGLGQGRKYGVRFAPMVLQDSGQLETVYGKAAATTIIGNSGCLLAFAPAPADNATAEFLSEAGGTHWVPEPSISDDPHGGPARINVGMREERVWKPTAIKRLPEFHALLFRQGMEPQPVYCAPYFTGELDRFIHGRYDSDPYHPAGTVPKKRRAGKLARRVAIAAAVIAGGIWLSHAGSPGGSTSPPQAPVERSGSTAPPRPGVTTPPRVSPLHLHHHHSAQR
jgi:type IV secretion system protein VirD4